MCFVLVHCCFGMLMTSCLWGVTPILGRKRIMLLQPNTSPSRQEIIHCLRTPLLGWLNDSLHYMTSADPPPLKFVRGGVLCTCLWVGEGTQRLFFPYYYQFFLARFARQYYTKILHVYIHSSACFYERAFSYVFL